MLRTNLKYLIIATTVLFSHSVYSKIDGQILYDRHCSSCHGNKGEGGVGVPLSLPSFLDSVSNEYLAKTIRFGRVGRVMPAFNRLSDGELVAIIKYIRAWSKKDAPKQILTRIKGNKKHGKELFAKHCQQCHGKEGIGGKGTGVTFSRKRELPIIAPALNNAGFLRSATDSMIRDTIIYGRKGTPMSSMLVAGLSQKDVDDVVSYIRSFEKTAQSKHEKIQKIDDESPIITADSPYDFDETLENLKDAITDQNFTLIRIDYLDHGLVEKGKKNNKTKIVHFCNFGFLYEALAIDPRVGMFLPCRVTISETNGKVTLSTINPKRLSRLFNNQRLEKSCNKMYEVYHQLLEDATS